MKTHFNTRTIFIFCVYALSVNCFAQEKVSPWTPVENAYKQNLRIDVSTLKSVNDTDIYVWALEVHKRPLKIEGIGQNIFKIKTYYLLNKSLMKYSILEIAYYDSINTLLMNFSYRKSIDLKPYKYNYPIMGNSSVEAILRKSLTLLAQRNEKTPK